MTEEQIILENQGLIYMCIKNLNLHWETNDEFQDYYDYGLLGLINGAKTYDESKGVKISSYLVTCIRNEICKYLYLKTLPKRLNPNGKDLSLNYIVENSEEECEFINCIVDPNTNVEEEVEHKMQLEILLNAINRLPKERDALIIKMYYGLENYEHHSLERIGAKLNLSRTGVNNIIKRTIPKIKKIVKEEERKILMNTLEPKYAENKSIFKSEKQPNNLSNLSDYLFEELERISSAELLSNTEQFEKEIQRSKAITSIAQTIINNADTILEAQKFMTKTKKDDVTKRLIGKND